MYAIYYKYAGFIIIVFVLFNVGIPMDVMHDVLEGVLHLEMSCLLEASPDSRLKLVHTGYSQYTNCHIRLWQ